MTLVSLPCSAIAIKDLRLKATAARWTNKLPVTRGIRHNPIQRAANQAAALTGFNSGSDQFRHALVVEKIKSVKLADKPDFVR